MKTAAMSEQLVVLAPNWLGDAVMALPAIADLIRASPDAVVDLAARPAIAPLVPLVPRIGTAVVLGNRRESIAAVAGGRYDAALLLPNSFHTAWVARSAGIPERWGYRNEFRSVLLTRAVTPPVRIHQAVRWNRG
jgi:heptosyltransferase-2